MEKLCVKDVANDLSNSDLAHESGMTVIGDAVFCDKDGCNLCFDSRSKHNFMANGSPYYGGECIQEQKQQIKSGNIVKP